MNDIVVGVDRSDTARRAAETAASLATCCNANLHLVMTIGPSSTRAAGNDHVQSDPVAEAETFLNDLGRALPHDRFTCSVQFGDPATAMCAEADRLQARMIVVGNRRVQGVGRVLGSIAGDVTKRASCDVLIANTTD